MQFHRIHGKDIEISEMGYESVATDPSIYSGCTLFGDNNNVGQWTLFSDWPITPGQSVELEVLEDKINSWNPELYIGLTGLDPVDWDHSSPPWAQDDITWCISTYWGNTWKDGVDVQPSLKWEKKFGFIHPTFCGDRIRLTRTRDYSVSITYNGTEFPRILTKVPPVGLWVVIWQSVKRLRISRDAASLQHWCATAIMKHLTKKDINMLPLPEKLKDLLCRY